MKRRYVLLFVVAGLLVSGMAFAEGQNEWEDYTSQWETVTVTGTISFENWPHPEITSGRTTYELMVPRFATDDLDVEAGDTITIEGIPVDSRFEDDEQMLMVTKAIINGEEYLVPHGRGGMGMRGGPGVDDRRFDGAAPRGRRGSRGRF